MSAPERLRRDCDVPGYAAEGGASVTPPASPAALCANRGQPGVNRFPDPDDSAGEEREITIGHTGRQRIVLVSHCQRGDHTRIISARKASKKERMQYEEGIDKETKRRLASAVRSDAAR